MSNEKSPFEELENHTDDLVDVQGGRQSTHLKSGSTLPETIKNPYSSPAKQKEPKNKSFLRRNLQSPSKILQSAKISSRVMLKQFQNQGSSSSQQQSSNESPAINLEQTFKHPEENDIYPRVTVSYPQGSPLTLNQQPNRFKSMKQERHSFELIEESKIDKVSNNDTQLTLQEKVFIKLLNDETCENHYCVDCGFKLQDSTESCFESIYVSMNHGIFLCQNCASTHQRFYGVEVSFVKRLIDNRTINESGSQQMIYHSSEIAQQKVLQLSKWTYTQLRVLIVSGGNKAFRDHMDQYDLTHETIQKRYSTVAAQYYRDYLRHKVKGVNSKNMIVSQPEYEKGRERSNQLLKVTKQIVPYSNLDNGKILRDLLSKDEQNQQKEDFSDSPILTINDLYEDYISDIESRNIENVDHYKQLCLHEQEIIANTKNPLNLQELAEYRETVLNEIDLTVPPYFNPASNGEQRYSQGSANEVVPQIIEPYSELGDYLDKDDFSNLLGVLGTFAGKSASGLLSVGESILSQFNIISKNKVGPESKSASDDEDYVVPGQQAQQSPNQNALQKVFSKNLGTIIPGQGLRNQNHNPEYKSLVKDSAQAAGSKMSYLGKSVWGLLGGASGAHNN